DWDQIRGVTRQNKVTRSAKLRFMSKLALRMHKDRELSCSPQDAVKLWNSDYAHHFPSVSGEDIIDELVISNGAMQRTRDGRLTFGHLSCQEYLAAYAIVMQQEYE